LKTLLAGQPMDLKEELNVVEAIAADLKEASKLAFDLDLIKIKQTPYFANNEVIGDCYFAKVGEKKE
jgi:hypothetical protein